MSKEDTPKFTNEQLAQGIAFLMREVRGMASTVDALRKENEELRKAAPAPKGKEEDTGAKPPTSKDMEEMSRSDFMNYVVDTIKKQVVSPLKDEFETEARNRAAKEAEREVTEVAGKYSDFGQWEEEISSLVEKTGLSVDDAYHLARARNPEKVRKLDDAAAAVKKAAEEKEKGSKDAETVFGGLTPTSSAGRSMQNMDLAEAGTAAWDETMAGFEDVLKN